MPQLVSSGLSRRGHSWRGLLDPHQGEAEGGGEMRNAMQDAGPEESRKYFKAALRSYPELKASGYLGRLWNELFVE